MGVRIGYGFDACDLSAENMVSFIIIQQNPPRLLRRRDECVFNERRCTAWQTKHTITGCTPIRNRQI